MLYEVITDDHPSFALLTQTLASLPQPLAEAWENFLKTGQAPVVSLEIDGRIWSATLIPLSDYLNRPAASMAILRDVTESRTEADRTLYGAVTIATLAAILLFFGLSRRIGRIERDLEANREKLARNNFV